MGFEIEGFYWMTFYLVLQRCYVFREHFCWFTLQQHNFTSCFMPFSRSRIFYITSILRNYKDEIMFLSLWYHTLTLI